MYDWKLQIFDFFQSNFIEHKLILLDSFFLNNSDENKFKKTII